MSLIHPATDSVAESVRNSKPVSGWEQTDGPRTRSYHYCPDCDKRTKHWHQRSVMTYNGVRKTDITYHHCTECHNTQAVRS